MCLQAARRKAEAFAGAQLQLFHDIPTLNLEEFAQRRRSLESAYGARANILYWRMVIAAHQKAAQQNVSAVGPRESAEDRSGGSSTCRASPLSSSSQTIPADVLYTPLEYCTLCKAKKELTVVASRIGT
eukprot:5561765-Alexandrium_andersonii.AAC.1